ncbi:MAG: ATPase [Bacteroidales bacterium]|nr:ATPase [Bacteroidales bacterium]
MELLPFVYGKIAEIQNFTDREKESKRLAQNFFSLINTIVISPRRWGKSSLVKKVAQQAMADNKDIRVCLLDIFSVRNESEFYAYFAQSLIKATSTRWEEWVENSKTFLSRLLPKISFSPDDQAEISFGVEWDELKKNPAEIIDLAETIAKAKKIKIVVCIDEFQSIGNFDDSLAFQRKLRSHWQHHQNVTYCLYGSKRHMLLDIFSNPEMPFYKFGDIMFLEKIDNKVWGKFIQKRFKDTGKSITKKQAEYLAEQVENHSYYVQQLAQQAWLRTKTECSMAIIDDSLQSIKNQLSLLFVGMTEMLTATQLYFLRAIIDGETVFGQENLNKYRLGTSANVIRIKDALLSKEIIDITAKNVEIQDPVFKLWLKEEYFKYKLI